MKPPKRIWLASLGMVTNDAFFVLGYKVKPKNGSFTECIIVRKPKKANIQNWETGFVYDKKFTKKKPKKKVKK